MAATLHDAGFKSCLANPDVWMRPNVKPDGSKHWEHVLCCMDNVLCLSHEPKKIMKFLMDQHAVKAGSIKEPEECLGAAIKKCEAQSADGSCETRWAASSDLHVKRAIADVETELKHTGEFLRTKVSMPIGSGCHLELDATSELDKWRASCFQGLIGALCWIVELGRVDILAGVAMLSRHLAAPRIGHVHGPSWFVLPKDSHKSKVCSLSTTR